MAFSAHQSKEALEEIQWPDAEIEGSARAAAEVVSKANRVVFFTGAGISTSAGIPDYRGPEGVWTLEAEHRTRTTTTTPMCSAVPTPAHMAIAALVQAGKVSLVVSTNVDSMHLRSGIPRSRLSELHGNATLEECDLCGKVVARYFNIHGDRSHYTGRSCVVPGCPGKLRDTIINFGEDLPARELRTAFEHAQSADVIICLGSSLTVSPANDIPRRTKEHGGKIVLCNMQRTPLDRISDIRVFGRVDKFMTALMGFLSIPIPRFAMAHRFCLWRDPTEGDRLSVSGVLEDGTPLSLFTKVEYKGTTLTYGDGANPQRFPPEADFANSGEQPLVLTFFDQYGETPLSVNAPPIGVRSQGYLYRFDPATRTGTLESNPEVAPPLYLPGKGPQRKREPTSKAVIVDSSKAEWFAVSPIQHCRHCDQVAFRDGVTLDPSAPCQTCENVGENMQCLTCFEVFCGRHVKGHMLKHYEEQNHPIVVGFADLSFWCYPCEAYIDSRNSRLSLIYRLLSNAKFGGAE